MNLSAAGNASLSRAACNNHHLCKFCQEYDEFTVLSLVITFLATTAEMLAVAGSKSALPAVLKVLKHRLLLEIQLFSDFSDA